MSQCESQLSQLNDTFTELQASYDDCGCGVDPCAPVDVPPDYNTGMHIAAVFIILIFSTTGVMIPLLGRRFFTPYMISTGKHFGTGIILACALVHMLQPAAETFSSPCLGPGFSDDYGAYAYLFSVIAIILMHGSDLFLRSFMVSRAAKNNNSNKTASSEPDAQEAQTPVVDLHVHSGSTLNVELTAQAYMLEFGFTVHSIFIGLAVAVAQEEFAQLLTALTFHQFFEGIGLGSRLSEAVIKTRDKILLGLIFAVSAPIGIAVGTGVTAAIQPSTYSFSMAQGILDSVCSGILLYVAFILMLQDFPRDWEQVCVGENVGWKRVGLLSALWLGAGLMAFVGKFL